MTLRAYAFAAVGLLILSLLAAVTYQTLQVKIHKGTIKTKEAEYKTLSENYETALSGIEQLRQNESERIEQQKALREKQTELENSISNRQQVIRKLQHENEQLKAWADNRLPDIVISMRERPTITAAADLYKHLQHAGALPPAGSQSAK